MRIRFQTNPSKSQFRDLGNGNWQILGVPIVVDNAVMNGVLYEKEENAKGLQSYLGKVVILRHPETGASALEGESLMNHYAGGHVINVYAKDGVSYADLEFKEALMRAQDNGEYYINRFKSGLEIGISTGLYFEGNKLSGTTAEGEEYHSKAIGQQGDHIALLPEGEDPAGGKDTFIKFNGQQDEKEFVVNIDQELKKFKESTLNADIESKDEGWLNRVIAQCKGALASKSNNCNNDDANTNSKDKEGSPMRKLIIAALNAAGVEVKDNMTDEELLKMKEAEDEKKAKKNKDDEDEAKAKKEKAEAKNSDAFTEALNAALKPITDDLKSVKAKLAENTDKELDSLAEQAAPLMGVDVSDAKNMSVNALHKVLAKNGVAVCSVSAANSKSILLNSGSKINTKPWETK